MQKIIELTLRYFYVNRSTYNQDTLLSLIKISDVWNIFKSYLRYVNATKSSDFQKIGLLKIGSTD